MTKSSKHPKNEKKEVEVELFEEELKNYRKFQRPPKKSQFLHVLSEQKVL